MDRVRQDGVVLFVGCHQIVSAVVEDRSDAVVAQDVVVDETEPVVRGRQNPRRNLDNVDTFHGMAGDRPTGTTRAEADVEDLSWVVDLEQGQVALELLDFQEGWGGTGDIGAVEFQREPPCFGIAVFLDNDRCTDVLFEG